MNTPSISFHPLVPITVALIVITVITAVWIFFEIRKDKRFRVLRTLAVLLAMIGIAGLVLRPSIPLTQDTTTLVITPGYVKEVVDSVLRLHKNPVVYHTNGVSSYGGSTLLPSYQELRNHPALIIAGEGLPPYASEFIQRACFLPAPAQAGWKSVDIPTFAAHRDHLLTGVYRTGKETRHLVLKSPAGVEDSLTLDKPGDHAIALKFQTRDAGNYLYEITEYEGNTLLHNNPLPVSVQPTRKLSVLFYLAYPTAEIRFLKNLLAEQGHSIQLRYQVSANRFRDEFVNRSAGNFRQEATFLSSFDLLITDATTAEAISKSTQSAWTNAVSDGLGLLILQDKIWDVKKKPTLIRWSTDISKNDSTTIVLGKENIRLPAPIRVSEATIIPVTTGEQLAVAGYQWNMTGKVGYQSVQNTYALPLGGKSHAYAALWIPLIETLSRSQNLSSAFLINTAFPIYLQEPVLFDVLTTHTSPRAASDSVSLPLAEDVWADGLWHGKTWYADAGWKTLTLTDSTHQSVYISSENEWRSLRVAQQQAWLKKIHTASLTGHQQTVISPVSLLWFYFFFLVGAAFLWLSPKL
jgi:hypothetical protein